MGLKLPKEILEFEIDLLRPRLKSEYWPSIAEYDFAFAALKNLSSRFAPPPVVADAALGL
jgi:hypothetical protein